MIIKKVFEGAFDDEVHSDFLKFSRGEFKNRYLVEGKKQSGDKFNIKTGPEFVNFFVRACLNKIKGDVNVKGVIVSTQRFEGEKNRFDIEKVKNFQGVKSHVINTTTEAEKVLSFMDNYPRAFFALSFGGADFDLKIKAKAPKSGKPGKESEDGPKADFCNLKTTDKNLIREFFFDVGEFSEIKINHTVKVDEIVYPEGFASMRPEEVREKAKRKGTLVRELMIDGKKQIKEAKFIA